MNLHGLPWTEGSRISVLVHSGAEDSTLCTDAWLPRSVMPLPPIG